MSNTNASISAKMRREAAKLSNEELMKHAMITVADGHRCDMNNMCFCCAALRELQKRGVEVKQEQD